MIRFSAFLISTAILASGPSAAQVIQDWDADGDGVLSQEEWNNGLSEQGVFSEWDANGDGSIASDEFASGLFGRFNSDGDETLTAAEWDAGIDTWFGEEAVDLEYSAWDTDGDGALTEQEFTTAFDDKGLFGDFTTAAGIEEADDGLGEDEFFSGLFDWFDADDDGGLIADEAGWFG